MRDADSAGRTALISRDLREVRTTVIKDSTTLPETVSPEVVTPAPQAEKKPRLRLEFLDGLRGLAALYVVISHILANDTTGLPHGLQSFLVIFHSGRLAVDVFIVLSGFCLMLPVAQSGDGQLRGGVVSYLKRRARRILPPYYAALILSLAFRLGSHTGMQFLKGHYDPTLAQDFSAGNLITHALLIHNLSPTYNMATNGPLWSVATEWQIYFIFPALLLPVFRKSGIWAALIVAIIVGALPHVLLPAVINLDWACPWYIGLFTMGMTGAVLCFRGGKLIENHTDSSKWLAGAIAAFAAVCVAMSFLSYERFSLGIDSVMGMATVALIIYCIRSLKVDHEHQPIILKLLDSRWAIKLGTFSYSLYLTHRIAMLKLYTVLAGFHLSPIMNELALLFIGLPWAVLFAYVFHLIFERRFMTTASKPATQNGIASSKLGGSKRQG